MKRNTTWVISSALCVALVGLCLGLFSRSSAASAQNNCPPLRFDNYMLTNDSLQGTYTGVLSGTLLAGPAPVQTAVSYVQKADGNGNIIGKATVNINGQVFPNVDYAGTYTVKTDGTISSAIIPSNGPLAGVTLLANGVATEIDQGGRIVEHRDMLHTGIVATSVVKRIKGL